MSKNFGARELQKCLRKLGFLLKKTSSKSHSHLKYYHKDGKTGRYPFFIIQDGKKEYGRNSCERYIQELKYFGFSKKEIEKLL